MLFSIITLMYIITIIIKKKYSLDISYYECHKCRFSKFRMLGNYQATF